MEKTIREHFNNLQSDDANLRYRSFQTIIQLTDQPVTWAYHVWDELLELIVKGDNHQRTIGVQVLSNLAKSDPERMLTDLDRLMLITKDEKFVTARHSLQCLWKIGIVNKELRNKLVRELGKRFAESVDEKNSTLIRYDIMVVMRNMYDLVKDETLPNAADALIKTEVDEKYRKKYYTAWKRVLKGK